MLPPENIYEVLKFANDIPETHASQLYQPYYVLLNCLFPPEEGYMILPKYKPPTQSRLVDFKGIYTIKQKSHVVFLLEVKSSEDLGHISSRQEADSQMREKFRHVFGAVSVGMLYGACAMGTKICIYKLHMMSRQLFPFESTIPSNPELVTDTAPVEWWNIDLLTPEGQGQLCKIVQHIKEMSTKIG